MKRFLAIFLLLSLAAAPAFAESFGWVPDPAEVKSVAEKLRYKSFRETPAWKEAGDLPDSVFMWKAFGKMPGFEGKLPPAKNQGSIGSCVSFGTNNAISMTLAVEIALQGLNYEYKDFAEEVTYGGSRVQIGGGKIRGDGSNGSWAAQFVQKYGIVARDKYGPYDLTVYSVQTCKQFGDKGCPKDLEPVAQKNPVKDITQVTTWMQAKTALAQGYGIAVCSNQGFQGKRDANGIKKASGSWAHCMALWGYATISGQEVGYIQNSWGEEDGPVGPGEPNKAGFWADAKTIEQMLKAGDSWAFSAAVGFPSRKIDWLVRADQRRPAICSFKENRKWYALLSR
jgi:hypothetical protein